MPRKKLKRTSANLLTESLVEINGLNKDQVQVIFDHANPKLVWLVTTSHRPGYIVTYDTRIPRFRNIRIHKSEYDRLVELNLIPDYLYD